MVYINPIPPSTGNAHSFSTFRYESSALSSQKLGSSIFQFVSVSINQYLTLRSITSRNALLI